MLQGLILRKILSALKRDEIGPHAPPPRYNNAGCTHECGQLYLVLCAVVRSDQKPQYPKPTFLREPA